MESPLPPLDQNHVDQTYQDWDVINQYVHKRGNHLKTQLPSCARGNNAILKLENTHDIVLNAAHDSLRGVMHNVGGLYKPKQQSFLISTLHDIIQKHKSYYNKAHVSVKHVYEAIHGDKSSQPAKMNKADWVKNDMQKPTFGRRVELYQIIQRGERLLTPAQNAQFAIDKQNVSFISFNTRCLLAAFDTANNFQNTVTLTNANGESAVIPNKIKPVRTSGGTDTLLTTSVGYNLYLLKSLSENDLNDIVVPADISDAGRKRFSHSELIYPSVKSLLQVTGLNTHPLILNEFQTEKKRLGERIAGQVGDYQKITAFTEFDRDKKELITLLGLDTAKKFDTAKADYQKRQKTNPNSAKHQKPVLTGKCPFGFG